MSESPSEKPRGVLLPVPAHVTQRQIENALRMLGLTDPGAVERVSMNHRAVTVRVVYVVQDKGVRSNQVAEVEVPIVRDGLETPAPVGRRP